VDEFSAPDPTSADTAWMPHGLCRELDPAVFFPSTGTGVVQAQRICRRCPVAGDCLEYALTFGIEHGVWGGVSERGRRKLVSQRRKAGHTTVRLSPIRRIQRAGVD
jgi:WhiB family transcriptional regulator, redox-sensing transcriptional regulator